MNGEPNMSMPNISPTIEDGLVKLKQKGFTLDEAEATLLAVHNKLKYKCDINGVWGKLVACWREVFFFRGGYLREWEDIVKDFTYGNKLDTGLCSRIVISNNMPATEIQTEKVIIDH